MMESKILLSTVHDGLAWAMDAACQALEAGKVYEVRYAKHTGESRISWHQVEDSMPVFGACMPHTPHGADYKLLGRFIAA